jgi:hypothetical protein
MKHISWYTSLNRMIQNVNVGKAEGCTDHDLSRLVTKWARSEHEVRGSGAPRQLQFLVSLGPETWCEMSAQQHSFEAAWIELGSRSRFYSNPKWCCGDTMVTTMLTIVDYVDTVMIWWSFWPDEVMIFCDLWILERLSGHPTKLPYFQPRQVAPLASQCSQNVFQHVLKDSQ